ncbi:MAG TPA: acyltransferase, partial [Candidatus Peribacteria bacterium]|nr:acyltransferase [Candidatus Peribacteria bacterium]
MAAPAHHRLPMLDALRGYAVIAVILTHVLYPVVHEARTAAHLAALSISPYTLVRNGSFAVQLFFLISGFVLYLPYAQRRRTMTSVRGALRFLVHRARRLLPLFFVSFLFPMFLFFDGQPWEQRVHDLTALFTFTFPFFSDTFLPRYNFPLWSLGIEIWLSLLLPLIIVWVRRAGIRVPLLALVTVSLAWRLVAAVYAGAAPSYFLMSNIPSQLDSFMFGIVLAQVHARPASRPHGAFFALSGAAVTLLGIALNESTVLGSLPFAVMAIAYLLTNCGLALLVHGLLSLKPSPALSAIANAPARQLGMMCYSLYVWHVPVLAALGGGITGPFPHAWPQFMAGLLLVSVISYRFVEFAHVADART